MNKFPEELDRGDGLRLIIDNTRLLLALRKPPTGKVIKNLLQETRFEFEVVHGDEKNKGTTPPMERINHTDKHFWIHTSTHEPIDEEDLRILKEKCGESLDWIGPVYQVPNVKGYERFVCPLPNVLLIKPALTFNNGDNELSKKLAKYGLKEVTEKSKYLVEYRYYVIQHVENESAYQIKDKLEKDRQLVREVLLESMPMIVPTGLVPNDTLYTQQWNMTRIQAGGVGRTGWDISTGENSVVICILDEGCDLTHPDLQYSTRGIRLDTMGPDGSPFVRTDPMTGARTIDIHGTPCAGIAAATFNNAQGVSGVAGHCRIMPLTRVLYTDGETARGIKFATDNGAQVINMSFGKLPGAGWAAAVIDPAIQYAHDHNVVMVSITHNQNERIIRYPATNPLVIAVGASDQLDGRKSPTTSDGECWWGSNFGPEISVVAPGVLIPTTDIQGADGYNTNGAAQTVTRFCKAPPFLGGTPKTITYPSTGDAAGDYFSNFSGTSAAAPHVAGLAALLQSEYTLLLRFNSDRVRDIIEQTAEKVGGYTYTYNSSHPNGRWNEQMGYGRINVFRALNFADVYIRDSPLDNGRLPFRGGRFWDNSDIVVRNSDDDRFEHQSAIPRRDNYIYVRLSNLGPATARNVKVRVVAVPFAGTEFVFPADWTVDSSHIEPVSIISHFDSIDAPGFFTSSTAIAKFKLESSQVDTLYGWQTDKKGHPCLLAQVSSENDYGSMSTEMTGMHSWESNNLAQRNISVASIVVSRAAGISSRKVFPFMTGNKLNMDPYMEIVIDRSELPEQVELLLNPYETNEYFPTLENAKEDWEETVNLPHSNTRIKFLDRTRLSLSRPNFKAIMTLEAGTTFEDVGNDEDNNITIISQQEAEWVTHSDKRLIAIRGDNVTIGVQKRPGELRQMSLSLKIPDDTKPNDYPYQIAISQKNTRGEVVGGVSLVIETQGY